jgi:hypothetical protein
MLFDLRDERRAIEKNAGDRLGRRKAARAFHAFEHSGDEACLAA